MKKDLQAVFKNKKIGISITVLAIVFVIMAIFISPMNRAAVVSVFSEDKALDMYYDIVDSNPNNVSVYFKIYNLELSRGNSNEDAARILIKGVRKNPDNKKLLDELEKYRPSKPEISVKSGEYKEALHIEFEEAPLDCITVFTLDGSEPSLENGTKGELVNIYTPGTYTLKAVVINEDNHLISETVEATYTIPDDAVGEIEFSHDSGSYTGMFDLRLKTDNNSTIVYTTDGSDPVRIVEENKKSDNPFEIYFDVYMNGKIYDDHIKINYGDTTIRAVAVTAGEIVSDVFERTYKVKREPLEICQNVFNGSVYDTEKAEFIMFNDLVYKVNKDGSGMKAYINREVKDLQLVGDTMYFLESKTNNLRKYVEGSNEYKLVTGVPMNNFVIIDDIIYYQDDNKEYLYKMNLDGSNVKQVGDTFHDTGGSLRNINGVPYFTDYYDNWYYLDEEDNRVKIDHEYAFGDLLMTSKYRAYIRQEAKKWGDENPYNLYISDFDGENKRILFEYKPCVAPDQGYYFWVNAIIGDKLVYEKKYTEYTRGKGVNPVRREYRMYDFITEEDKPITELNELENISVIGFSDNAIHYMQYEDASKQSKELKRMPYKFDK